MSVTMNGNANRPNAPPSNRFEVSPSGPSHHYSPSLAESDMFFETPTRTQPQRSSGDDALVDSFSLFGATASGNASSAASSLYNPIVFNQQFSQFQRVTNGGKFFPAYQQQTTTEISEVDQDEEAHDSTANRGFVQRAVDLDGGEEGEGEGRKAPAEDSEQSLYENYMIDYDADFEQYYDPSVHYQAARPGQHYTVEEEGEEVEYFGGNVLGDNEVSMDMVADAKTYGLMLPPYHHFKAPSQPMHPQFQMIQHPYMYGNPFSYNLHTIVEESENESSLQTMSSITSSNFQSLQFDQTNSSLTPTNAPNGKSSQIGELSDPSLSDQSAESSPSLKEKFSRKQRKALAGSQPPQQHMDQQRMSGENFSEISFTSSSTFSENGSEHDIRSDEEEETFQVITANSDLTEHVVADMHDLVEPDTTTSRLERYFTSSLLEANRSKASVPKIDPQPVPLTLPKPPTITITPAEGHHCKVNTELTSAASISAAKPKTTFQQLPQQCKLQVLKSALATLLVDPAFKPLSLNQIVRLNSEFLRFDWIAYLRSILGRNWIQHFSVLGAKVYFVFRSTFSSPQLRQHTVQYLIGHSLSTSATHLLRDHQLFGEYIRQSSQSATTLPPVEATKDEGAFAKSQIQITINMGQSMIIIKNDSHSNASTVEVPQIPYRSRKEVKLRGIQSKRLPSQAELQNPSKMIYRTVLQVNDVNGGAFASPASDQPDVDDRQQNMRISKLLNQSNPLNRNFLVKSMLNDNSDSEEKTKQQSEIYGWIQRKPSDTEPLYGSLRDETASSGKSKGKANLLNSSTQLLLGSLRSKERSKWSDSETNANNGKFKTISNHNAHSKLSSTRSDAPNKDGKHKLERSQKSSKSFRDQRTSTTLPHPRGQQNGSTTWDSIYGGGIKLLKNISFVRNKARSSTKEQDSPRRDSVSSESSDDSPSRNKSLSEPNLHKANRNRNRVNRAVAEETDHDEGIYATIDHESDHHQPTNSKSTPHLTGQSARERSGVDSAESVTTSAMSTPSLLYRLSNPVACSGNSMTMRSISTSSLRTRRKNDQTSSQYGYTLQAHNGEWQKMAPEQQANSEHQDSSVRTRKPSSLRMTSSDSSAITVHSSAHQTVTSSHYYRSEIVESITRDVSDLAIKSQPAVQTVTAEATASAQTIGELSVAVNYEMRIGSLEISIHKCRIEAIRQKADLYVKVYLLPDRSKSSKRKTKVVKAYRSTTSRSPAGQLHAEFNETLRFTGPFGEFTGRRLWLSIWNNDKFGRNEPIAEMILGTLDSSLLSSGQLANITWYPLNEPMSANPKPSQAVEKAPLQPALLCEHQLLSSSMTELEPPIAGTIFLAIKYQADCDTLSSADYQQSSTQGSLHILIKEAQNLQFSISVPNTIGSTFCKLLLIPERSKQDREKSTPIKCPLEYSSNPRWNQTFVFHNLSVAEVQQRTLEISVWFQVEHAMQKSGKKLFVGGVRLSCDIMDSTANEVNLWTQLLERRNMWAYGEIPLRQLNYAK